MANNRIYFVYRPTGRGVYLGKRMASGYYDVPDSLADNMRELFDDSAFSGDSKDDFEVVEEISDGQPFVIDSNKVTEIFNNIPNSGLVQMKIDESVPMAKENAF